jgi:hypothetical protein
MKHTFTKIIITSFILLLNAQLSIAQLERIIVEKYYITDSVDAADVSDPISGGIAIGTTTYRVFVDLAPGSKLKKIFGDVNHPFKIASDTVFFNHLTSGQSFAKEFAKIDYEDNIVGLDSWLTLGQTSKNVGNKKFYGVPKNQDDDGNYFAGVNNSAGLLTNNDPLLGIPLTTSDGIDTMNFSPNNWQNFGVLDFTNGLDSTIFGSISSKKEFLSTTFFLSNSGVSGVVSDSNQILIAQLTTSGSLSFMLNLEIEKVTNGDTIFMTYVAYDTLLQTGEIFSPFLSYPQSCGCDDPDFLEYSSSYVCYLEGSCQTPIKIGCMDSMACNYDPEVNLNIENLCCYPGKCNNRDIAVVCPELRGDSFEFLLHPNPVNGTLYLDVYSGFLAPITYTIFNTFGVKIIEKKLDPALAITGEAIETSTLDNGLYHIQVEVGNIVLTQLFIKN